MKSFTSMREKIQSTGLYSVKDNTNINTELRAYATGIDLLFSNLELMLKELFIDTAESYGIAEREKLIGAERSEYSIEKRREMLKDMQMTRGLSCTPKAFEKTLESYGLSDFTMVEKFVQQEVVITVKDVLTDEIKNWVVKRIQDDFPSHLTLTVVFS